MKKTLLFLADQPWQTKLCAQIISQLRALHSIYDCKIVVVDFYSILHEGHFLDEVRHEFDVDIIDFLDLFLSWNEMTKSHCHSSSLSVESWRNLYEKDRSFEQIQMTNQLTYGFERNYYLLEVPNCCREQIFLDLATKVEKIFNELDPAAVISIERQTLPVNLAQVLASVKGIPWLALIPTRIDGRWILWDGFGLGTSDKVYSIVMNLQISREAQDFFALIVRRLMSGSEGTYMAWVGDQFLLTGQGSSSTPTLTPRSEMLQRWVNAFIKQLPSRFLFHPRKRLIRPRLLDNSSWRLTLFEVRGLLAKFRYLYLSSNRFKWSPPDSEYIFWALHVRPEGSSNVLSLGQDEVDVIAKLATLLPPQFKLVVKENPLMFGQRSWNFYRDLSCLPNIVLAHPFSNSIEFIRKSSGVAGIAGTVLLEAEILSKPSISFAQPEFVRFMSFSGWDELPKFLQAVQQGKLQTNEKIAKYVAYLFENSSEGDLNDSDELVGDKAQLMAQRIAKNIHARIIL